jgi:major membrane immunogen (membrane-anchored lipoprotein)
MFMKRRILLVVMALILVVSMFAGCSAAKYKDGVYYAIGEPSNDWRDFVVVTVEKGKITDAYWGGVNTVPQGDKRVVSENGGYDMVAYGGAKSQWYEQAKACEDWLIKNQDPAKFDSLYSDAEGRTAALTTDTGASVSIHVKGFFTLVAQALASEPVPAGQYGETRVVTASGEPSEQGWKDLAEFIVVNGTIVAANYDALYTKEYVAEGENANAQYFKVDGDTATAQSKDQLKEAYGMTAAGSALEWYQQAQLLEEYIVKNQTIFAVNADGYADGIAGVSVHAVGFYTLFNQAFGK